MTATRWYLTRTKAGVALVVEETAEPHRGYMATVTDRQHARAALQTLRRLVQHIDDPAPPRRTYDPETVEAFKDIIGANGPLGTALGALIGEDEQPRG